MLKKYFEWISLYVVYSAFAASLWWLFYKLQILVHRPACQ